MKPVGCQWAALLEGTRRGQARPDGTPPATLLPSGGRRVFPGPQLLVHALCCLIVTCAPTPNLPSAVVGDVSALTPGGVRIGSPAMTSRGLKEAGACGCLLTALLCWLAW